MKLATLICLLAPSLLWGASDQLKLRSGLIVSGTFLSGTTRVITFLDQNGATRSYNISDVQSITFGDGQTSSSPLPSTLSSSAGPTLPAGTEIAVRTNENIDSSNAPSGATFSAVIDRDVLGADGAVLIPKGADARLTIRKSSSGGLGTSQLALDLDSVTLSGRQYNVSTEDVQRSGREGLGKNRRTAEMLGGGAVLGTLLGAIAGGGKGAAIGAVAGAAAGGTTQVLTRGSQVKVPSETVLTFRLDQPLHLQAR
ncbi:MAG: hypothetical protein IT165_37645 [Bryobacterales bacterium]|nr:hypothetical protein [Bryobacterales bacterium]